MQTKKIQSVRPILQDVTQFYTSFSLPASKEDCGEKCRVNNPSGKPFCCDPDHAIPALYDVEYTQLKGLTQLWLAPETNLHMADLPEGMGLHRCRGPNRCECDYRSISCRSFPFFPYVSSDYVFMGLAIEWELANVCWLAKNLGQVQPAYRKQFVAAYDKLFCQYQDIFDNYHEHSERSRQNHNENGLALLLLHRNGKNYSIDPKTEKKKLLA